MLLNFGVVPEESPCKTKYCTEFRNTSRYKMQSLKISQDIKPLSEIKTGITKFIKQVHGAKGPLIMTQYVKSVDVLLDAYEYEAIQEKRELLTDIQVSLNQLEKGQGVAHEDAKENVLKRVPNFTK
jgi:antitoxin YefM